MVFFSDYRVSPLLFVVLGLGLWLRLGLGCDNYYTQIKTHEYSLTSFMIIFTLWTKGLWTKDANQMSTGSSMVD